MRRASVTRRTSKFLAGPAAAGLVLLGAGCDEKNLAGVDRTAPEVAITSPGPGASVSGVSFVVEVTATDDVAVDRVEVDVNGETESVDTTAPYRVLVFTLAFDADDDLSFTVRAVDTSENSSTATATVTVSEQTITRLTDSSTEDMNPTWSPDGASLAFQARRPEGHFDLWTMGADGSNQTRITENTNEDRSPAWSPTGDLIAFDSNRAGSYDIWVLPVAGSEVDADSLTFGNRDNVEPAWTPDGATIYFVSDRGTNGDFNIWRVSAGGGAQTQVTSFFDADTSPAVSPDGLRLAFVSGLNFQQPHVYTMDIGAEDVTPLTGDVLGFSESDPAWAPTSDALLYGRADGEGSNVWGIPLLGDTPPTQATFGSGSGSGLLGDGGAVMSPDGSRIAFHSDRDGNLEIYILQ